MDSFATIDSSSGILKHDQGDDHGTALSEALRRKRLKIADTKLGPSINDDGEPRNADEETLDI